MTLLLLPLLLHCTNKTRRTSYRFKKASQPGHFFGSSSSITGAPKAPLHLAACPCTGSHWISLFCHRGKQTHEKTFQFKRGKELLFRMLLFCCCFLIVTLLSVFYSTSDVMFTSDMFLAALSSSDESLSLCKQVACLLCAVPLSQQPEP